MLLVFPFLFSFYLEKHYDAERDGLSLYIYVDSPPLRVADESFPANVSTMKKSNWFIVYQKTMTSD